MLPQQKAELKIVQRAMLQDTDNGVALKIVPRHVQYKTLTTVLR